MLREVACVLACVVACAAATADAADDTPALSIHPIKPSLGRIARGDERVINLTVTNTSDRPVTITNVAAGCGCFAYGRRWPDEPLEPGQSGTVSARAATAELPPGRIRRPMAIVSDDPTAPRQSIWVQMDIVQVCDISPWKSRLRVRDGSQPINHTVHLTVASGVELGEFQIDNERVTASFGEPLEGGRMPVEISVQPPFAPGSDFINILVPTNHPLLPHATIQLVVMGTGVVRTE